MSTTQGKKKRAANGRNRLGHFVNAPGPGRKKGVPNKATAEVRAACKAIVDDPPVPHEAPGPCAGGDPRAGRRVHAVALRERQAERPGRAQRRDCAVMGVAAAAPLTHVRIPYKPRQWARGFHASRARWVCLVLHRRAGKTTAVINHHQRAATDDAWEAARLRHLVPAVTKTQLTDLLRHRFYGHVLPTYKQAKLTTWEMLKYFATPIPGVTVSESELRVDYPNGSRLQLFGADNPDALRGAAFSGLSFDEYGLHPPNIFSEVLSKALADHMGYAIFAGTIKGRNQLYRTYEAGKDAADWFTL